MAKERNFNPVQAQRKADKAKAIKKGKADVQSRRNEKLARRNPDRIHKQIDDLKAVTTNGGKLSQHEQQVLEGLEKELRGVQKAREALGDKAPSFSQGRGPRDWSGTGGVLGKRRRDREDGSSDEDTPEDIKSIPMPRDTPPPIPKEVMDEWWARRRARRQAERGAETPTTREKQATSPPSQPLVAQTVYEAKPMVRNLQKEAVSAFVPSVVRTKLEKGKGRGGLIEPEEADRLEQEGYLHPSEAIGTGQDAALRRVTIEDVDEEN